MNDDSIALIRRVERTCRGKNVSDVCDALISALLNVITHALIQMDENDDAESRKILVTETKRAFAAITQIMDAADPEAKASEVALVVVDGIPPSKSMKPH